MVDGTIVLFDFRIALYFLTRGTIIIYWVHNELVRMDNGDWRLWFFIRVHSLGIQMAILQNHVGSETLRGSREPQ